MIAGATPETGAAGKNLSLKAHLLWSLVALVSFHAAQIIGLGWLLIPCAYALIELSRASSRRKVFYPMLVLGFLFYAPQLAFFWNIFKAASIALWLVLAVWLALFGLILYFVRRRFGDDWMLVLAPFIWTGLEYFRCELYYLRFGWMTFGMAGNFALGLPFAQLGVFGCGFVFVTLAALAHHYGISKTAKPVFLFVAIVVLLQLTSGGGSKIRGGKRIPVAGVQLEFPNEQQIIPALNRAHTQFTNAQLFMLSEYTFQSPPPQSVRDWCATNRVYLVVGGTEPHGETFYNTAYVIGTNGTIVHQQVKSVPIQFFKDGLPAPERKVWDSPWGKLGVLTCYDLSYTRVVDDFVRQGAVGLLNPTMDVAAWGAQQHNLHARVAPVRAAEYDIPIFRVASSGISQIVFRDGSVIASAPFQDRDYSGEGEIIGGQFWLSRKTELPPDRWFAPLCVLITCFALLASLIPARKKASADSESAPQ